MLVPSRFAADYHAEALGLRCEVVPTWSIPTGRSPRIAEPRFVTFVDPSAENGAYVFARIADELGRVRPDIPLLIVGARGSGATLAGCGIDVFARGNVAPDGADRRASRPLAASPAWPSLPGAGLGRLARLARRGPGQRHPGRRLRPGAVPEVLGGSGARPADPGPDHARDPELPTADEVAPWVEAIARLWDDAGHLAELGRRPWRRTSRRAGRERTRRSCGAPRLRPGSTSGSPRRPGRSRAVVLVPFFSTIERPCEESLRELEEAGVRVVRSEGCPQIDVARNMLASDALNRGAESILFIDADLGFDPLDALRLLARPEPVVSGVYAKKRQRALASVFAEGIDRGRLRRPDAPGPYPLRYAAGGFLRIKAEVLRRMIDGLGLPACNTAWGRRDWPFFLPMVAPDARRDPPLPGRGLGLQPPTPPGRHHPAGRHLHPPLAPRPLRLRLGGRRGAGTAEARFLCHQDRGEAAGPGLTVGMAGIPGIR